MKAAIVEAQGILAIRDIPRPEVGDYDVLCEFLFGATCTGTDQHIIHNRTPWPIDYPVVLGHESVGRALELGPRVRHFSEGDLITRVGAPPTPDGTVGIMWGGFAEYGIARDHRAMREDGRPESEWSGYRVNRVVPPGITPQDATMIITWRETLSYLTRMGVGPAASLLVLGSGGNGLAFVAHAKNMGVERVAMIGSPAREQAARATGASMYLDYRADALDDALREAHPAGFDFIIDAVGKQGQIDRVLPALKPGGTVGIYGIDDFNGIAINPRRAPGTFTYAEPGYDEAETHDRVIAYMQEGKLDAGIWLDLDHPFPLADIGEAFEAVEGRRLIKALVQLSARS